MNTTENTLTTHARFARMFDDARAEVEIAHDVADAAAANTEVSTTPLAPASVDALTRASLLGTVNTICASVERSVEAGASGLLNDAISSLNGQNAEIKRRIAAHYAQRLGSTASLAGASVPTQHNGKPINIIDAEIVGETRS